MTASRAALLYTEGLLCLLYALLPSLTFPNPPLDVVEGFAWGRDIQLGYTKHPPMQAWLLELSYHLTGGHAYGAYWLSALSIGVGFWFIWLIARELGFSEQTRVLGYRPDERDFLLHPPGTGVQPQYPPDTDLGGNGLSLFARFELRRSRDTGSCLGALAAVGFYTKYFVFLLIGTIGLYALVYADGRRYLATTGPWICTLSFLLRGGAASILAV